MLSGMLSDRGTRFKAQGNEPDEADGSGADLVLHDAAVGGEVLCAASVSSAKPDDVRPDGETGMVFVSRSCSDSPTKPGLLSYAMLNSSMPGAVKEYSVPV